MEIVLTLFALHQLLPSHVHLNRGNHEESSVCGCHGFKVECVLKYDEEIYRLCLAAFSHLPLGTRCNSRVLVVHAGIDDELSLPDVQALPARSGFAMLTGGLAGGGGLKRMSLSRPGVNAEAKAQRPERMGEEACKRVTSMLWNDPLPRPFHGVAPNTSRGVGQYFGSDVFERFMARHPGLELVSARAARSWPHTQCTALL